MGERTILQGAWVKILPGEAAPGSPPAVVFVPEAVAVPSQAPLEVHLAVTSYCALGCSGCYQSATPSGSHVLLDDMRVRIREIAASGALTVAFGGGEPLTNEHVYPAAAYARELGLTCVITTSGAAMPDNLEQLRVFNQVNVSYDGQEGAYERVRGVPFAKHAERAIEKLAKAGIRTGLNIVLTRATFEQLQDTLEKGLALGAVEAQLLRYKPVGRAFAANYAKMRLTDEQHRKLPQFLQALMLRFSAGVSDPTVFDVRIDCALVPFLSEDAQLSADQIARAGILGCEAGRYLSHVRANGSKTPCSFLPAQPEGKLAVAPFEESPCITCALQQVCRGGCQAVSLALTGALGPDPECPRVMKVRGARVGLHGGVAHLATSRTLRVVE
jgi:MoaA/NifB/PqqE/SkfB family radical SAM enzyme